MKNQSCQFVEKCQLKRSCEGCRVPIEAQKYEDLAGYKIQYNDHVFDSDVAKASFNTSKALFTKRNGIVEESEDDK